jgi:nucleoside diphosphate kinase
MQIIKMFTAHPETVGESYGEHLGRAAVFGARMVLAGLACMLHAVLPFMFVRTGSRCISELHEQMVTTRSAAPVAGTLRADLLKP